MTITRDKCILTYNTSLDRYRRLAINDVRPGLTASLVSGVADLIRALQPFDETVGNLTGLARAELVTEITTVLIAPPTTTP